MFKKDSLHFLGFVFKNIIIFSVFIFIAVYFICINTLEIPPNLEEIFPLFAQVLVNYWNMAVILMAAILLLASLFIFNL